MTVPPYLTATSLTDSKIAHGFFGRQGGVSTGLYESLNCSIAAAADTDNAALNRQLVQTTVGAEALLIPYQIHSAQVTTVLQPFTLDNRPHCDALVTRLPGIALGILTADCVPVLFADAESGVIGAAHAGWQGALGMEQGGIAQNTLSAMHRLGARIADIRAVIGPAIQQQSYEVGDDLRQKFIAQYKTNDRFFAPNAHGKFQFDLPGYVRAQLIAAGLQHVDTLGADTYSDPARFFSYRRATHASEPDYGRQLSVIMLKA